MLTTSSWDDWVLQDRLRKFTEENNELRQDLQREANESRARTAPKSAAAKKKTAGSDFSSARGSEERHSSLPVTGRGSKRGRDTEIEKVGDFYFMPLSPGPCPDLEHDYGTDFGGSEVDTNYQSPDHEPDFFIASYDGTGDEPPRRSGRARVPKNIFDPDLPGPVAKASKAKNAKKAVVPAKGNSVAPSKPATPKKDSSLAINDIPSAEDIQATASEAVTVKDIAPIVSNILTTDEKAFPSQSPPVEGAAIAATNGMKVTEDAAVRPPSPTSMEKSVALAETGLTVEDGHEEAVRSSSSSLTPPPPVEEDIPPSPIKPAAKAQKGRKPPAKGKGKGKVTKKGNPRKPKTLVVKGPPKTVADILAEDPPREIHFKPELRGVPQINQRFKSPISPTLHQLRVTEKWGRGAPSARQPVYVPHCDRWREESQRNYFYAGIPADMPRRPRNRMGPPRVSPARARWMKYYKAEKAKGTTTDEIERTFAALIASEKESTASSSGNEQSTSAVQSSQEESSTTVAISGSIPASSDSSSAVLERAASVSNESTSSQSSKKRKASAIEDPEIQASRPADPSDARGPQEPTDQAQVPQAPAPKKAKKARKVKKPLTEPEQEEIFTSRPAVRIPISDHLKALLVDDWENVTKNLSLVPLPSEHPVTEILSNYYEEEKLKRRAGSAEADLLQEIVAGIKEYFNQSLGRILLYRFEREQYFEVRKLWEEGKGGEEWEGKGAADAYGAEHLSRLFGRCSPLLSSPSSTILFSSLYPHLSPSLPYAPQIQCAIGCSC